MPAASGNLSVEAQVRYAYVEALLASDFSPPAAVVELGSAPGDQIAHLSEIGYTATSVDLGEAPDAWGAGEDGRMRELLQRAGVAEVVWNLENTPYPLADSSFDAVLMTEVYEHLREYPVLALKEVHRILKPGGRLYFTTPNAAYLVTRFRALIGRSSGSPLPDWIGGLPHARHAREYTFAEMDLLMRTAGLEVVLRQSRHFHLTVGRSGAATPLKRLLALIARIRPTFGPEIVMVCERPAEAGSTPTPQATKRTSRPTNTRRSRPARSG
ncbi:MAG: methyltransferase domain-containing protein [Solirubrobacteraceae bacterium]